MVGVAVALTFGVRAARAHAFQAASQRDLAVLTLCLGGAPADRICPPVADAAVWRMVEEANVATARRQRDRALLATALGLLALGLGLRGLARCRWVQDRPGSILATVWGLGESLLALTCLQLLALTVDSLASQLTRGLPLTGERLDTAVDSVLVLVSLLTGR
jgi:hypothetical protein